MTGRPSSYSDEMAETICDRLIEGLSLRKICEADDMPDRNTVMRWMDANPQFAARCARARELQADYMDDLILDTANASTPETAPADRVKISAYQWRAAKLQPKRYGDKMALVGGGKGDPPVRLDLSGLNDAELEALEHIRSKLAVPGGDQGGTGEASG